MLPRKWLVTIAAAFGLAAMNGSAWAHSGAGGSQGATDTSNQQVVNAFINTIQGYINSINGNLSLTFGNLGQLKTTNDETGRSGALSMKGTGIWMNGGYTSLDNGRTGSSYDGHNVNGMVGIDNRVIDPLTVGLGLGYENTNIDTAFNAGNIESDGFIVSPYAVYRFNRNYSADAVLAYTRLNTDVERGNNFARGSYDSDRYVGLVDANGNWTYGKWRFGGTLGYLYVHQDDNGYIESSGTAVPSAATTVGQGRVGGRIGYAMTNVETYFSARYEYDFISTGNGKNLGGGLVSSTDRDGVVLGMGANFRLMPNVTGTIEGTTTQGREDLEIWGVNGTIRIQF